MKRKKAIRAVLAVIRNAFIRIYRVFHRIHGNEVTFISFGGGSYSDNPRAVSEKLHEMDPDAAVVWILTDAAERRDTVPDYVRIVDKKRILRVWKTLAATPVFVTNENCYLLPKHRKQFFITTWHGDRAFKKILFDAAPQPASSVPESIPGYCDLVTAGSDYGEMQFRSAFAYEGEILKAGCPRNDILVHPEEERNALTRAKLGINNDARILLYAPTLRKASAYSRDGQELQDIDLCRIAELLEKKTHEEWLVLVRAHPIVSSLRMKTDSDRFMDATRYNDMADLLAVSDMLITDYSSCAGDFALTGRPILLFQSDIEEYEKNDRAFYFKMEDSPYFTARTQEEAERILEDLTPEAAKKNCEDILRFYNTYESGEASTALAERIIERLRDGG